jgi:uncharacterized phage-associated protein
MSAMQFTFDEKKTTQAAGVLLRLSGDRGIAKYHFIKMLYLADREALDRWGEPITGDNAVLMKYGPVLSTIYDLTKGQGRMVRSYWEEFITDADEETNQIFLKEDPGVRELSKSEIRILEKVYLKFKNYTWKELRDYCHSALPEYRDVGGTSKPLPAERILKALGKSQREIEEAHRRFVELQVADLLLGR